MPRTDNPVLGTIECNGCGGTCSVHQASRGKGRMLYTRCGECGADQRTGKAVQTRLWTKTDWRPEAAPIRPPNVDEDIELEISEKQPEIEPVSTVREEPTKKANNPVKKGPLALLGVLALGVVAVVS